MQLLAEQLVSGCFETFLSKPKITLDTSILNSKTFLFKKFLIKVIKSFYYLNKNMSGLKYKSKKTNKKCTWLLSRVLLADFFSFIFCCGFVQLMSFSSIFNAEAIAL